MTTFNTDKFLYQSYVPKFNSHDAAHLSLKGIQEIKTDWEFNRFRQIFLKIITLGIASFFLEKMTTKDQLKDRIKKFQDQSIKYHESAKKIQKFYAQKKYKANKEVSERVSEKQVPLSNNMVGKGAALIKTWWKEGKIDLLNGARGQIIWTRTKDLLAALKQEGYYVFLHAHSYPITLHLELAADLQTVHQSATYKAALPRESQRKFRAPDVARHFNNTSHYLRSDLGQNINKGLTMDDNHRETIISCDALPDNTEAYESTQHFFKSNKSIVDTHSSTGLSHQKFDTSFLKSFIRNPQLLTYAAFLFTKARASIHDLPGYGMIRVIAIKEKTLETEKTNYVWRAHAFGRLCTCTHTPNKYGHAEFIATLKAHQNNQYGPCKVKFSPLPQYRILASNVDRDTSKMVFTMDCLNNDEKGIVRDNYHKLRLQLSNLIRIEALGDCTSVAQLVDTLKLINPQNTHSSYHSGIKEVLRTNAELIREYAGTLKVELPKHLYDYVMVAIG